MTLLQIQTRNSSQSCGLVSWVEEVEVSTANEQNQSKPWVHILLTLLGGLKHSGGSIHEGTLHLGSFYTCDQESIDWRTIQALTL